MLLIILFKEISERELMNEYSCVQLHGFGQISDCGFEGSTIFFIHHRMSRLGSIMSTLPYLPSLFISHAVQYCVRGVAVGLWLVLRGGGVSGVGGGVAHRCVGVVIDGTDRWGVVNEAPVSLLCEVGMAPVLWVVLQGAWQVLGWWVDGTSRWGWWGVVLLHEVGMTPVWASVLCWEERGTTPVT